MRMRCDMFGIPWENPLGLFSHLVRGLHDVMSVTVLVPVVVDVNMLPRGFLSASVLKYSVHDVRVHVDAHDVHACF